jgi:hypothetical protein
MAGRVSRFVATTLCVWAALAAAAAPACRRDPRGLGVEYDGGPPPDGELLPVPGEVYVVHLPLGGGELGDASIIVGPDGTIVLLDVGNDGHADDVAAMVERLNGELLTPERGYPRARAAREVDHVVLTHLHADHIGGAGELLGGYSAIDLTGLVVLRGLVDTSYNYGADEYERLCLALTGDFAAQTYALCTADAKEGPAPCNADGLHHAAAACPGLAAGDLTDDADDGAPGAAYLPLGEGARLYMVAADGWLDGADAPMAPGYDGNDTENARSLAGVLVHGAFRYHFGGDLTGGMQGSPDVETLLAGAAPSLEGVPEDGALYGTAGVDVYRAHHHGLRTSSNDALLDALLPADGRARNVVVAASNLHVLSSSESVLDRLTADGRLGGGGVWQTMNTTLGGGDPLLVLAEGRIVVRTIDGGAGYWMQALVHDDPERAFSLAYPTVR